MKPAQRMPPYGVYLQARLGSTRLPEKVLLPLAGKAVVEHAMLSLKRCGADVNLLLTDHESAARLEPLARKCGFELFPGASEDVLARFAAAAERHPVEHVIRATADNPLVSSDLAVSLLELHRRSRAQFSGYVGMPLGLGVEIVERGALLEEDAEAEDPFEREHVNPYLYRHPERFHVLHPEAPEPYRFERASVTLDTAADYRFLQSLFDELYEGRPIETLQVIDWLRSRHGDREEGGWQSGRESIVRSHR